MRIPILGGSWQGRSANANAQHTKNLLCELDPNLPSGLLLFSRPGLASYIAPGYFGGSGELRAMYRDSMGHLNVIVGHTWRRYNTGLVGTTIGTLGTNSGPVWIADNSFDIVVMDYDGGNAKAYTPSTDTFENLGLGFVPSSVCLVDAYFVFGQKDSRVIYTSDPNSTAITSTHYASKEGSSDKLVTVISDKREAILFGEKSSEVWYNEGDPDFPLRRRAFLSHGTRSKESPAILDNSIFFLDSNRQARRLSGYDAQIVSTRQIEYQWAQYDSVDDAIGIPIIYQGHALYLLVFPTAGKADVYDASTQQWQEFSSIQGYDEIRFRVRCGLLGSEGGADTFNDKILLGDYRDGEIWEFSEDAYLDGSARFRKSRTAMVMSSEGKHLFYDRLHVEAETGVGRYEGTGGTTLNGDVAADATTIVVTSATGIEEGYGLEIVLDDATIFACRVTAVIGTTVGLSTAITGAAASGKGVSFYDYEARFPTIDLDYSDDGAKTWSNKLSEQLGGPGDYGKKLLWTQLGESPKRNFRLETDAPAKIILSDAYLKARLGTY